MSLRTGLWRHADFLKLWSGQTLSALGSTITSLALSLTAALALHASALEMGLLSTAATLPNLLFGLVAGLGADRMRRRWIMLGAELSRALLLTSIPLAAWWHVLTLGQLYAVVFLAGTCTTFFDVAQTSYLPSLVGREHIVAATSRVVASTSVAMAVGPGIAGALIQVLSAPIAILVDALCVAVSGALILIIRSREAPPHAELRRLGLGRELIEGLRPLAGDPVMRSITAASMLYLLFSSSVLAVYVLYVTRQLGITPGLLGVIFGVGGLGTAGGAALAQPIARRLGIGVTLILTELVGGLCTLLIPLADQGPIKPLVLLLVAQGGWALAGGLFVVIQTGVRQTRTPDAVRGRMTASYRFLTMGIIPLGSLLGGVLGGAIGLRATLVVAGLGTLLPPCWLVLSPVRGLNAMEDDGRQVGTSSPSHQSSHPHV